MGSLAGTLGDLKLDATVILMVEGARASRQAHKDHLIPEADDEDNARLKKLGLWGGSHKVIAPWDWRKLSKVERDEFR